MNLPLELRMYALGLPIPAPEEWRPTANVLIIDVGAAAETGGDKVLESLRKDSALLRQRAEGRRRAIGTGLNKDRREDAERDKLIALEIAARLVKQDPALGLPGKTSDLVRRILTRWPPNRTPPKFRTLCRYLTGK